MNRLLKNGCTVVCVLGLSACATIVGGRYQHVAVDTNAADQSSVGANCTLTNDRGTVRVTTPATATVHRSSGPLDISCNKDGAQVAQQTFHANVRPMVWGNILFGGLIGIIVDFSNGAAHHYPDHLSLTSYSKSADAMVVTPAAGGSGMGATDVQGQAPVGAQPPSGGLASLDRRISPGMFNAAQNVAAAQRCERSLRVLMAEGERALLESECPGAEPIHIECQGASCTAVRPAAS
ncbi:hypothetical protein SAMN05216570_0596 [Dyella sp. OK004]|uniref:hypothetical protein n=1 Tax=Dyella sp. OK004 TaxID=1855292 RepID=UPI0008DEC3BF|nr:hypothetical protein [Dyella sp. OK004]SFR91649.1 hypothetical protein SAMN05216570_0596 [Dyella sp. OK004]